MKHEWLVLALFPWTLWAGGMNHDQPGGILSEPGIQTSGQRAVCDETRPVETETIMWHIQRANGETWFIFAGIANQQWIGYQINDAGRPVEVHWGRHDGDQIIVEGASGYTPEQHFNFCKLLYR